MRKFLALAGAILFLAATTGGDAKKPYADVLAERVRASYSQIGVRIDSAVLLKIIHTAKEELPQAFPDGSIDLSHVLAICAVESQFYPMAKGGLKEVGLFQILRPKKALNALSLEGFNPFDVETNTLMGIHVLRDKYLRYKNVTKAIIAYNGVVKKRDGWDKTYLLKFRRQHARIVRAIREAKAYQS